MPHVVGHSPGGKKEKKEKKTPDTSAYQSAAAQGYMGAGYTPSDIRKKESKKNVNYIPPSSGGTITTTSSDGGQTIERLNLDEEVVSTQVIPPPKTDTKTKDDEKKDEITTFDLATQTAIKQNLPFLTRTLGATARLDASGNIVFIDKTGSVIPQFKIIDALGAALDKVTGFNPDSAFGDMGATGKAALFDKISNMSEQEFTDFVNRKGNLDRILEFAGEQTPELNQKINDLIQSRDMVGFANLIKGQGGADFDEALMKKTNPQLYYQLNPPQTSGQLEEAAMAGISYIPGYGPVERPDRGGQQGGIGDIAQGQTPPPGSGTTPPPDPGDLIFRTMYRPNFTPSYTGGPEQIQLAGGFFDPITKKIVYDPYGTANLYKFSKGGIANFKNYGY
jgi:hypothetical protein